MSRCGRTSLLESLVLGELSAPEALELRAHAQRCVVCRHELRWAETEKTLFAQRAARDEVRGLWAQTRWARPKKRRLLPAAVATAAAALLFAFIQPARAPQPVAAVPEVPGELLMTLDEQALMTPAKPDDFSSAELEASLGACLIMSPSRGGYVCPPGLLASFATGN